MGLALIGACGGAGDTAGDDEADNFDVGSAFEADVTTTQDSSTAIATDTATATTAVPTHTPETASSPPANQVVNRSDVDDPSGWRLTLVVADAIEFAGSDDIRLELTYANTVDRTLFTNADQQLHFALARPGAEEVSWNDRACSSTGEAFSPQGAVPWEPGESGRFTAVYPDDPRHRGAGDAQDCRVGPGEWNVRGALEWCPNEAIEQVTFQDKSDPVCREDGIVTLFSSPVTITINA